MAGVNDSLPTTPRRLPVWRHTCHHARRLVAVSRMRRPAQATTEYALILLVAAVVAILVIGWATTGGGGGRIGGLFDSVLDMILRRADSAP